MPLHRVFDTVGGRTRQRLPFGYCLGLRYYDAQQNRLVNRLVGGEQVLEWLEK